MWQITLELTLAAVLMWWAYKLSRDIIRAIENQARRDDDVLDSAYPVFSRKRIVDAYLSSVIASQRLQGVETTLYGDPVFSAATNKHQISEDISDRMLAVTEAMLAAERAWYRHSTMMEANTSVIAGRQSRDEALTVALQRFDVSRDMFGGHAVKARDEWKARLENAASDREVSPRPYSNPWAEYAHSHVHHWTSDKS
jgi:hypothetical protein